MRMAEPIPNTQIVDRQALSEGSGRNVNTPQTLWESKPTPTSHTNSYVAMAPSRMSSVWIRCSLMPGFRRTPIITMPTTPRRTTIPAKMPKIKLSVSSELPLDQLDATFCISSGQRKLLSLYLPHKFQTIQILADTSPDNPLETHPIPHKFRSLSQLPNQIRKAHENKAILSKCKISTSGLVDDTGVSIVKL